MEHGTHKLTEAPLRRHAGEGFALSAIVCAAEFAEKEGTA